MPEPDGHGWAEGVEILEGRWGTEANCRTGWAAESEVDDRAGEGARDSLDQLNPGDDLLAEFVE